MQTRNFWRWVDKDGLPISFLAGVDIIKKEYTCIKCAKTFLRVPKYIKEKENEQ
jgi:hypothetical protein